jgi:hypothetical protein
LDQYNRLYTEREQGVKELQGVKCCRDHDHTSEDCENSRLIARNSFQHSVSDPRCTSRRTTRVAGDGMLPEI